MAGHDMGTHGGIAEREMRDRDGVKWDPSGYSAIPPVQHEGYSGMGTKDLKYKKAGKGGTAEMRSDNAAYKD